MNEHEYYIIHLVWIIAGGAFGFWMYARGATRGLRVGVHAASIYMMLNGQEKNIPGLVDFINDLSTGDIEKHK